MNNLPSGELQRNVRTQFKSFLRVPDLNRKNELWLSCSPISVKYRTTDPTACPCGCHIVRNYSEDLGAWLKAEIHVACENVRLLACFSVAGAPETDSAPSSSEDFLKEEGSDEAMTPSRPRTTEDLFAAIHRYLKLLLFPSAVCMRPPFQAVPQIFFSFLRFLGHPVRFHELDYPPVLEYSCICISSDSQFVLLCSTDFYDNVGSRGSV